MTTNSIEELMLKAIEQAIDLTVTLRELLATEDPIAYNIAERLVITVDKLSGVKKE